MSPIAVKPTFKDRLADELWRARNEARPVPERAQAERITAARGADVAAELYGAMRTAGSRQIGWKLALTTSAAQARFGVDRSFSAPVFDTTRIERSVRRSIFVEPLLEAEIGLAYQAGAWVPVACIEIADCRFAGWRIDFGQALADFGLHGAIVLGEPRRDVERVEVTVRHEAVTVASGAASVAEAVGRAQTLAGELGSGFVVGPMTVVASGSFIQPLPLKEGLWDLDFGSLGVLELRVAP